MMKIKNPKLLTALAILLIMSISVLVYSLVYTNKLPMIVEQINNGTIGVILTAIVTVFLLGQQSQSEELKDKNSKVFEKKLDVYHTFITGLEKIIQDGKISTVNKDGETDELTSLLFQLAQVRMHTEEEKVLQILQSVAEINRKLADVNEPNIDHQHLADCLFIIVNTLRWELYKDAEKNEKALDHMGLKNIKKFKEYIGKIVDSANWATANEENKKVSSSNVEMVPLTEKSRNEIIKKFEEKIVVELTDRFTGADWIIEPGNSDRIHVTISNKNWVGDTKVGIYDYPDADRLCFATWYNGKGFYKDVYLIIRREFSGRYNRYNWWRNFKEPYNKWDGSAIGTLAVEKMDEEFIKYITDELVKIATNFNGFIPVYENLCEIKAGIETNPLLDDLIIYESSSLISNQKIKDNGANFEISTQTSLNEDKWEIDLIARNPENINYLLNQMIKEFPVEKSKSGDYGRFIYKQFGAHEIKQVTETLQNLHTQIAEYKKKKDTSKS